MHVDRKFLITFGIIASGLCGLVFLGSCLKKFVKADEQIKILPSNYSIESIGDVTWQNPQNVFNQDLSEDASIGDFNDNNSAFIQGSTYIPTLDSSSATTLEETATTILNNTVPTTTTTTTTATTTTTTTSTIPVVDNIEPTTTITTPAVNNIESTTSTTSPISFLGNIFSFFVPWVKAEETTTIVEETTTIDTTTTITATTTTTTIASTTFTLPVAAIDSPETTVTKTTTEPAVIEEGITTPTSTLSEKNTDETVLETTNSTDLKTSTSTVPETKIDKKEGLNSSALILSGFDLGEDVFNQMVSQNVQLRFSLAGEKQTDGKIVISYFYHNEWQNLGEIDLTQEISNHNNGGYFLYALPIFESFQEFQNFKVKFQISGTNIQKVSLDSAWIELDYDTIVENKDNWNNDEDPEFDFTDNNEFKQLLDNLTGESSLDATLDTPDGKETKEGIIITGQKIKITKNKEVGFKPGHYKLKVKKGGQTIIQDFNWGVLTVNTNKSIYLVGETVNLQMGSLKDDGHTLCNSNLKLEIVSPTNVKVSPIVSKSEFCGPDNVTDKPDYFSSYLVQEIGKYKIILTNLDNGYNITSTFEVRESVPFDIERIGPTRIYPPATYKVFLNIKTNQDYKGKIIESVPDSFIITNANENQIKEKNGLKQIIWQVDWHAGETYSLSYNFKAPEISPYIYLLGPLKIDNFKEIRQWQIASDAPFVFQMKTGYYVGDGNSISITGLGFKPQLVIIKPDTAAGSGALFKTTNMLQNNTAHFIATADLTTGSVQFNTDGFDVLGVDSNTVNVRHTWIAFAGSDCTVNGTFCVGQYTGTGSAQSINTGFQPDLVWVKRSTSESGNWRSSAMPTNYGEYFAATAENTAGALFTTLDATGFSVGATNSASTGIYYYVAFKNTTDKVHVGTYAGLSGAQSITSATFAPDFVFVKSNAAVGAVYNVNESYGNYSSYFSDTANLTAAITGLTSTGFDVGTSTTANGSGATLYYAAFGGEEAPSPGSGTFTMAKGTYTGTGNYINVGGLGFKPDLIIVKGDTAQYGAFRTTSMGGDSTAYLDAPLGNFAGGIVAITGDGFTIGTSAVVNTSSATYYWTAYGNAWNPRTNSGAADFYIGAYYGNGIDDRNITGLPYQADLVVTKNSSGAYAGVWKSSEMAAANSGFFSAAAETTNYIQALNSDGFQVGTGSRSVNYAGTLYFYFGFKESANFVAGTYSGNAGTNNITSVGFQPDNLWIKATGATQGVTRTSSVSGDGALPFLNTGNITNAITALISNGFSVTGTAAETNTSGSSNYRYVAWRGAITPTIQNFQMKTGNYVGDGNGISITGLGFKPQLVIIKPDTAAGSGALFKTTNMLQNNVAYFIATADLTTGDIQLNKDGFDVLGANSNSVNVRHTWIAFAGSDCTVNGTFCVGQYTGTGSAQSINTGFQPDLVWVKRSTSESGNWRSSAMPTNYGEYFAATAENTAGALFTTLDATGFSVGATNSASTGIYYYVAFKNTTDKVHVGTYAGLSGAQSITSATFAPDFVFVKSNAAVGAVYNVNESYGNYSSYFSDTANLTAAITGLTSTGFDVGTSTTANGSGATLYYAAFGGEEAPSPGSGTFTMAKGTYTGTGNYINVGGLGFKPDLIIVKGDTAQYGAFRTTSMGGDSTAYLDAPLGNFAGGIVAITGDGFTIGTSAVVNTSSATYYWTAYGNAWNPRTNSGAADFYIGAYYGNGIDDRNITGLPYQADLVVTKNSSGAYAGVWKSSEMAAANSGFFSAAAETTNYIQALNSDGFQVGTGSRSVNYAGTLYFYFGFKESANFVAGTYSGNAGTNNITSVGFQPDNLWIKATGATQGVTRTSSVSGDGALPFLNTGNITNAITALISNGFSVTGTAAETNTSGSSNYRYVAWLNPTTFNQSAYRLFNNTDTTDVGTALAAQNTPITLAFAGKDFRLRMLVHIGSSVFSKNSQPLKLLFAQKVGSSCGDDETFTDVTSSSVISFKDNTTPNDEEVLTFNSNDPTHGTDTVIDQTYVESNNFTNAVGSIEASQDGKWDFALYDHGAPSNTTYCFQIVKDNGSPLNTYTVYPEVTTAANPPNPVVSNVQLNGQNAINLTESTTTPISATANISDPQGCSTLSNVTAKIYRSGVTNGKDCTADANNCYTVASCTQNSCSGTDATYTCTINMQYYTDPTDTGTPWSSEYWKVWIQATDADSNTGNAYNTDGSPDVNSLLALTVTSTINYGNFDPGSSSTTLDKQTIVTSTGNVSLDVNIYGTNMTSGGDSITVSQQRYSLSSGTAYASGVSLLVNPGANADTNICKNTSTTNQTKNIWWGIAIPDPQPGGTYSGSNTFSAVKNAWSTSGDWCEN